MFLSAKDRTSNKQFRDFVFTQLMLQSGAIQKWRHNIVSNQGTPNLRLTLSVKWSTIFCVTYWKKFIVFKNEIAILYRTRNDVTNFKKRYVLHSTSVNLSLSFFSFYRYRGFECHRCLWIGYSTNSVECLILNIY